jgi:hypothetical protein
MGTWKGHFGDCAKRGQFSTETTPPTTTHTHRYLAIAIAIAIAVTITITQSTLCHFRGDYPCGDCAFANRLITSS